MVAIVVGGAGALAAALAWVFRAFGAAGAATFRWFAALVITNFGRGLGLGLGLGVGYMIVKLALTPGCL